MKPNLDVAGAGLPAEDERLDRFITKFLLDFNTRTKISHWKNVQAMEELKTSIEKYSMQMVLEELRQAITEYNRLQEYMTEPSRDLNFGNKYLLNRIQAIELSLEGQKKEKL